MIYSEVIIVGGGPAGSTCGWKLRQNGIECLILDKQEFPRIKLCAGWITPQVINDLKIDIRDYPLSIVKFNKFHVHIYNKELKINVHQYAIRRYEFDYWLLKRCGVSAKRHEVKNIKKSGDYYNIDDQYLCKYLVGAGGTYCPVYKTFFRQINPRAKDKLVVTLEEEFPYNYHDGNCHLWFYQNKLPGYSWYVPKSVGYLNIGIGAFFEKLKVNNTSIKSQWKFFIQELERLSLLKNYRFNARGYIYYIRDGVDTVQIDNIYLVGDAAGLATKDMGEGIGAAVKSGLLAADAIITGKSLSLRSVRKYSFPKYQTRIKILLKYLISKRTKIN
jgi:flavin-dependent dehydrogenase